MCDLRKLRTMPDSATSIEFQNGYIISPRQHLKNQPTRTARKLRLLQTLGSCCSIRKLRTLRKRCTVRLTVSNEGNDNGK